MLLGDVLVFYLILYLTLVLRYRAIPTGDVLRLNYEPFSWLLAVWLLVFYVNGLYDLATSKNDVEFYNKILRNVLINYGLATAYFYLLTDKLFSIKPQTVFFIFAGIYAVAFLLWRYWYNALVQWPNLLKKVLVLGMNDEARELIGEISRKPQLGYKISAIIHDGYRDNATFPGIELFDSSVPLKKLLREKNIGTVITVLDPHTDQILAKQLYENLSLKLQFFDLPTFYEKLTGKIPVTNIGHIWFLDNLTESEKTLYEVFKRLFDIVVSIFIITISLPFLPFLALLIKMSGDGPVFFTQTRIGYLGRPFLAIKFRSMVQGAEKNGEAQWASQNDPRVTRFGRILRRTRIDEIPQLLNILRGEMSIVGPRPERPEFVKNLRELIPFYDERHLVKPGLTGWAQINFQYGASVKDALKKLQYDLFYIKNRSLPLDMGIVLKTANIILSRKGQ